MIHELKVNNQSLKGLVEYSVSNEPIWASDAGRSNMAGTYTGTFNGYCPNLVLTFLDLKPEDFQYNAGLLENPIIDITYEDPKSKQVITKSFVGSAIGTKVKLYKGRYEGFSINLVAVSNL